MKINLLPWREQQRAKNKKRFLQQWAVTVLVSITVLCCCHWSINYLLAQQNVRNNLLKQKIAVLAMHDRDIALSRVLQEQQHNNHRVIELLAEVSNLISHDMFLTDIQYDGDKIKIMGKAKSGEQVSGLIRQAKQSRELSQLVLQEMKVGDNSSLYANDFLLEGKTSL